jgi:hypothetical protein
MMSCIEPGKAASRNQGYQVSCREGNAHLLLPRSGHEGVEYVLCETIYVMKLNIDVMPFDNVTRLARTPRDITCGVGIVKEVCTDPMDI